MLFCTYALLFWYASELIKDGKTTFVDVLTSILTLMLGALGLGLAVADMSDQRAGVEIAQRIFARIDAGRNSGIDGLEPMPYAVGKCVCVYALVCSYVLCLFACFLFVC